MRMLVRLILAMMVATAAGAALAQPPAGRDREGVQRHDGGGRMSNPERQRLREDVQRQHAHPGRGTESGGAERERRYAEWQRLSPEQREGIRRDMRDANRNPDRRER